MSVGSDGCFHCELGKLDAQNSVLPVSPVSAVYIVVLDF
jgi:hypothetical protein